METTLLETTVHTIPHGRLTVDQLIEDAELRDRVSDLEADNRVLRELLSLTLAQLHDVNQRAKVLTLRVRALTQAARSLQQRRAA